MLVAKFLTFTTVSEAEDFQGFPTYAWVVKFRRKRQLFCDDICHATPLRAEPMTYGAINAGLVFVGVTLTLFCASTYALYAATFGGAEFAALGLILQWPMLGLFLVLRVGAGLVASHVVYRRSARAAAT
jgi:hypothetical protein